MNRLLKILAIVGVSLLIMGCVIFVVAMSVNGWNFSEFTRQYETKTLVATEPKSTIVLDLQDSDVQIVYDASVRYVTVEYAVAKTTSGNELSKYVIVNNNGELRLREDPNLQFWFFWSVGVKSTATITLPNNQCSLSVDTDNGKIVIDSSVINGNFVNLDLKADNGSVTIDGNVTCTNLDTTTNNDKIVFNGNVIVTNELKAVSDNGAIIVDGKLTANSVSLKTNNGAITANGTIDAQRLHFETQNGKITALLEGKNADYGISVETRNGSCNVNDSEGGARKLFAKTRNGSIEITFAQ